MAVLKSTHACLKWQDYKNLLNVIQNNGYVIDKCDSAPATLIEVKVETSSPPSKKRRTTMKTQPTSPSPCVTASLLPWLDLWCLRVPSLSNCAHFGAGSLIVHLLVLCTKLSPQVGTLPPSCNVATYDSVYSFK